VKVLVFGNRFAQFRIPGLLNKYRIARFGCRSIVLKNNRIGYAFRNNLFAGKLKKRRINFFYVGSEEEVEANTKGTK